MTTARRTVSVMRGSVVRAASSRPARTPARTSATTGTAALAGRMTPLRIIAPLLLTSVAFARRRGGLGHDRDVQPGKAEPAAECGVGELQRAQGQRRHQRAPHADHGHEPAPEVERSLANPPAEARLADDAEAGVLAQLAQPLGRVA